MKLFVTGSAGFVGSHLAELVPCIGSPALDIRAPESVAKAVADAKPDCIIHLAAQTSVAESLRNPRETYEINFMGTFNLLESLKSAGFSGKLLFVSSGDVYGRVNEEDLPIFETQIPDPRSPYAVSKLGGELLCHQLYVTRAFEVVIARSFNHVGPRQSVRFAVSDFARQICEIKAGKRPRRLSVGDIDATRDFLDVRDVVGAYLSLLKDGKNGGVYNVCSGTERSLRSIIDMLLVIAGADDVVVEFDPSRGRNSEQRRAVSSYQKLNRDTGWKPKIEFEQTLRDLIDYWMNNLE